MSSEKRPCSDENSDSDSDNWVGPMPSEAAAPVVKKRKVLEHEDIYLENLPLCDTYEKSFMHRDTITHVLVTKTEFIVTAGSDGHVKFWKKLETGVEFVKHFRAHLEAICDMCTNSNGLLLCTASVDKTVKVFDVINFDMINMFKTPCTPKRVEWTHSPKEPIAALTVSDSESGKVYIYDGKGDGKPLAILDRLHTAAISVLRYNPVFDLVVSADVKGIVDYWGTANIDYKVPKAVKFDSKLDTDLYTFVKAKTYPIDISFSLDGSKFASISMDRHVRVFRVLTGKLVLVLDESLARFTELQQKQQQLPHMEFGRRMAQERDLEKSSIILQSNIIFDNSGFFLLYGTMLGVKVINLHTRRIVKMLGKAENMRPLHIALFQGAARRNKAAVTLELEASDNPVLESVKPDPTLFCTAAKKNRFYLFSRRPADDTEGDRDVFNEKPSKEDIVSATESSGMQRLAENAILHTEMGDIHIQLFLKEAPKACENFCVHARNGYFNGHTFHRVIKGFMVQTGDPTGTGSGGESIWGAEFEDEFHPNVRHDKPYTVSMANAGPNSNGSQFFITVAPTPWLDNKHTVFGRVNRGMEVVLNVSNVKTNPKTDKPHDEIRILSVALK